MYSERRQSLWTVAFLSLVVIALFVALPGAAAASTTGTALSATSTSFQVPAPPTFAMPGFFSLTLGEGFSSTPEGLTLESAELAIPAVNAVATVTGLSLDQNMRLKGWDTIAVTQNLPRVTDAYSLSNTQLAVGGPNSGYSTVVSAHLDLHGSQNVQVNGTLGISYDGLARALGLGVRDGNVSLQAGPLGVTVTGANTQSGIMTIDKIAARVAGSGSLLEVGGFQSGPRGVDWNMIEVSQDALAVGNALTISPLQLRVGDSTTGYTTTGVVGLSVNAGDVARVRGELTTVYDGTTRQMELSLQNGSAEVWVQGFGLGFDGLNVGPKGTRIDSLKLQTGRVGLTAEVNGLAMDAGSREVTFDKATIQYQPEGTAASSSGGFVMQIDRTEAGYVMTTTTLLSVAVK